MGEFDKVDETTNGEFCRLVQVTRLENKEETTAITATATECAAIAKRLRILSVDKLSADVTLKRLRGGKVVRAAGRLDAEVTQACVVTLAPVVQKVQSAFTVSFAEGAETEALEVVVDLEEDQDAPESIDPDGFVDLGEILVQQLALALDDYPRAAGAEFAQREWGETSEPEEEDEVVSPFAALKALKGKDD